MRIPAIGLGTWELEGVECRNLVLRGLELGYRHIDTAWVYGNHGPIGDAIKAARVDRSEIFLTTKLWAHQTVPSAITEAVKESLKQLRTDYVDLLLIHWPGQVDPAASLEGLRAEQAMGRIRYIGVSNFAPSLLNRVLESAPLLCVQAEYHPFLSQDELLRIARKHDLMFTAYRPFARGRVFSSSTLQRIAHHNGRTVSEIALRWLTQQDHVAAIPRSANPAHLAMNLHVDDFRLSNEEMRDIASLAENYGGVRSAADEFGL